MAFGEKIKLLHGYFLAILSIALIILVFGAAYFTIIKPRTIEKPSIPKPELPADAMSMAESGEPFITAEHMNYLANEIGAYRLDKLLISNNNPVILFNLSDTGETFYTSVEKHMPSTAKGIPESYDLTITSNQRTAALLLSSNDIPKAVNAQHKAGNIQVELVSDMKTLAAKGYLALYDAIK
ncbi:hypothetical protein HYU14_00280 [Candidatus Woesearchaeota archaeon]|nr:hypothetical protein [Candidatus Woesearchaeota archaeon]